MTSSNPIKRDLQLMIPRKPRRSGYVYIAVLMTSVIVAALAMSSIWIARKHHLDQSTSDQAFELASAADSAVELALAKISADSAWRNNHVHNTEYGPFALGGISLYYRLLDAQNDIGNGRLRDITVIGIAKRGNDSYAVEVKATPAGPALTCLNHGIAINDDISLSSNNSWMTDKSIYAKKEISLNSLASMTGSVISSKSISGTHFSGPTASNQPDASFPNHATFARYTAEATTISISSLPSSWSRRKLNNCLLSPNHNPFNGQLNSKGIYFIDCDGANLDIENCRIIGTLILQDLGYDSKLKEKVFMQPAVANYPCLYVNGELEFESSFDSFSEASIGINLNPAGAPYQGVTNTTQTDIYPATLEGLVICRDQCEFIYGSRLDIEGVFVAADVSTSETHAALRVKYDSDIAANPPPGFRQDTVMRPIQGTYRRVATP